MSKELSQFDQLKADISVYLAPVSKMLVTDVTTQASAAEAIKQVNGYIKKLEERRDALVRPLNEEVKTINSYAKEINAPLDAAKKYISTQLLAFEAEQEKIRQKRLREEEEKRQEILRSAAVQEAKVRADLEAKQKADAEELKLQAEADSLFGDDVNPAIAQKAAEEKAAHERAELEAKFETAARVRDAEAMARASEIESTRLKGVTKKWKCEVTDIDKVPKEFLVRTLNDAMVLASARAGNVTIPGVRVWQETGLAVGKNTGVGAIGHYK